MNYRRIFKVGIMVVVGMGILGICFGENKKEGLKEKIYNSPEKASLEELFEGADCVVMGKVEKVKAKREIFLLPKEAVKQRLVYEEEITGEKRMHLLEERRKQEMVYTYIKLIPEKWFKGEEKKEVLIKVGGGKIEDLIVKVTYIGGTPVFKKNEEVFVFLEKEEPYFSVLGNARGKYIIEKDKIYNPFFDKEEMLLDEFIKKIEGVKK